ncbi:MATE family efflux transporter [Clostridium sp. TW13]|uniref:MATE family efflux transporter n=2 Tax=Inconstantimicrobium mannanitabidum TaxID=1604901 RepID=A0ACB5RHV7_9CLOT|nr:MATE family efflux transporter [Clostridium sp. TW13]
MKLNLHKDTVKDVLKLSLPAVGEMILYTIIWVVDTMMVGHYGGNIAVSSVGLSTEFLSTYSNVLVGSGISVGITSIVARYVGANKIEKAEEYATIGFFVAIILAILGGLFFASLSYPLLVAVGADNTVAHIGASYMHIASIAIFFTMLINSLSATLRAYGNTKTPLFTAIVVNIINIVLDYGLIFGKLGLPQLGAVGSAIATSTAQFLGFIFIAFYFMKHSKIKLHFKYIKNLRLDRLKSLLHLSIPAMLQEGSYSISRLICNIFIVALGTIAFSANQITTTIESISFMPGWGFAVAATTLVGQKVGEKNYKKAKEYAKTSLFLGTITMVIFSVLFLFIPGPIFKLFISSNETEVIKLGTYCLMVAAIEQPFLALSMISGGILKGSGDTKTPFKVTLFTSWVIRFPLMFVAIFTFKLSVVYVWIITAIQWAIDGSLLCFLYKKKFSKLN